MCVFILTIFVPPLGNQTALQNGHAIADYTSETTWYHDCSNLTAFDGIGNDTWITEPGYNVSGTMNSSGSYFYADDYGMSGFTHGPLRYHTLSSPIQVSQFISLEVELEVFQDWQSELGQIMVVLYDDFEKEIMTIHTTQTWDPYPTQIEVFARWSFSNETKMETPVDIVQHNPYRDTLKINQNETGLFASFPRIGNYSILDHDEVESDRNIKYIAIYIGATFTFPPTDILRVHNLLLRYGITDTGTISSTTTTESTTPTTTTISPIDPQTIAYILAGAGLVAVVVIALRRRS